MTANTRLLDGIIVAAAIAAIIAVALVATAPDSVPTCAVLAGGASPTLFGSDT